MTKKQKQMNVYVLFFILISQLGIAQSDTLQALKLIDRPEFFLWQINKDKEQNNNKTFFVFYFLHMEYFWLQEVNTTLERHKRH